MTYKEKLMNPKWQKKRLEILQRDNFTCQLCKSQDKTLTIHHFSYSKNPWDTQNHFLLTLCFDCHKEIQRGQDAIMDTIKHTMSRNYDLDSLGAIFGILDCLGEIDLKYIHKIIRNISSMIGEEYDRAYGIKKEDYEAEE